MRNKLVLLVITILVVGAGIQLCAADVPHNLQVKLMLKILSMDRNFSRFGDPIKIGVSDDAVVSALSAAASMKIKGKSFVAEKMGSPADISKYKVIYVGKNWAAQYAGASAEARSNSALMFCETESGVLDGGGSVSFKVVGTSPKIVVNLENAKQQGTDFPAGFLKITVVVGGLK